jgi:putative PIN family toxin of toxin-antitoxin system
MRAVLDTNVLVSAILKDRSLPAVSVYRAVARGSLLKSTATEQQLFAVLARSYFSSLAAPTAIDWLRTLLAAAELVPITERIAACRDPTDDMFLELAVNGRADIIVSGDADLLVLNPFRGIPIMSPAMFVRSAAGTTA